MWPQEPRQRPPQLRLLHHHHRGVLEVVVGIDRVGEDLHHLLLLNSGGNWSAAATELGRRLPPIGSGNKTEQRLC